MLFVKVGQEAGKTRSKYLMAEKGKRWYEDLRKNQAAKMKSTSFHVGNQKTSGTTERIRELGIVYLGIWKTRKLR